MSVILAAGCNVPVNRNQEFDTAIGKVTRIGNVYAPFGGQTVAATFSSETGCVQTQNVAGQSVQVCPGGNKSPVYGTTSTSSDAVFSSTMKDWPTNYIANDMYMPANWTVSFTPTQSCLDPNTSPTATPPYPVEPATQSTVQELIPGVGLGADPWWYSFFTTAQESTTPAEPPTPVGFTCFVNTPANPEIIQTAVQPRFVLDDLLPASVQVSALTQINAAPSQTFLRLFSGDLTQFTATPASSVAPGGLSATFPYPTQSNGWALPAGAYIGTITTDVPNQTETTNSIEPFVIGHDARTYPGAFGIAYINYSVTTRTQTISAPHCSSQPPSTSTVGASGPMITSITQNALLFNGQSYPVGSNPTVVLPINFTSKVSVKDSTCSLTTTDYSGAQSAFVVNTGSNNISIVQLGEQAFPSGTVAVGHQPVAAMMASSGLVYVANYGDGTISEVNPATLTQTRVLPVMQHPTSLSFDGNGVLWVGGQGYVDQVSISNWSIAGSTPVDGTVSGMGYSPQQQELIQMLQENGTVTNSSQAGLSLSPVQGGTHSQAISYAGAQTSYSTVNLMSNSGASSSGPTITAASNASYIESPVSQYLAFPAQTAFVPQSFIGSGLSYAPLTAAGGDVIAVATGNTFVIGSLPSGDTLLTGSVPYPIRGAAVGNNTIYFTMTESNSVVSLPFNFQ